MACPPPHTHTAFKNILALAIAQLTFLIAKLTLHLVGGLPCS